MNKVRECLSFRRSPYKCNLMPSTQVLHESFFEFDPNGTETDCMESALRNSCWQTNGLLG